MSIASHCHRLGFGLGWIATNVAGYGVALAVWEAVSRPLWPALSGFMSGSVTLAFYGATLGLGASLAQLLVLRLPRASAGLWVATTTVGLALGFVAGAWMAFVVSRNGAVDTATNLLYASSGRLAGTLFRESLTNIVFGLVAGAGIGVGRWLLVRTATRAAVRWILVSAIAFELGFGLADGMIQLVPPFPPIVYRALFGACAGAIIGLVEWLWLGRQAKVWRLAGGPIEPPGVAVSHGP